MKPINFIEETRSDRAVSPVIGVILMVAITVILAAVIGAFVLEIGDQQETAPSTSFDSEQATEFYDSDPSGYDGSGDTVTYKGSNMDGTANLTTVYITHAGGDVLEVTQTQIVTEGNDSAWGVGDESLGPGDEGMPQPDFRPALGSNDAIEFSSGNEWNVIGDARNVQQFITSDEKFRDASASTQNNIGFMYGSTADGEMACPYVKTGGGNDNYILGAGVGDNCYDATASMPGPFYANMRTLQNGDSVDVVWTASSGGKTQNLFKYTVQ